MSMQIINHWGKDKTKISKEQQKKDLPELKRRHEKSMRDELLWDVFGGVIVLSNGNKYQVVDLPN